jgi:hypothetical protein
LYIVIGVAWAFFLLFALLALTGFLSPSSASLTTSVRESKLTKALFFSVSTLTTIGSSGEEALT